jgi:hypothetical protein
MAVFRAITAEEESATAVFHALMRVGYQGSKKLNPRNHIHKAALHPFLAAIENNFVLAHLDVFQPAVEIDSREGIPRLKTRITLTSEEGKQMWGYPIPPLHLELKLNGKVHNFADELLQLTDKQTIDKVIDAIKTRANTRNQVLYATRQGIPCVSELPDDFFFKKRDRLFLNLIVYLLIDPYPVQQFVQQALNGFLSMLGLLPQDQLGETP